MNILKKEYLKNCIVVSVMLFVIAFATVVSTIPQGFEHLGDMGTSATGVAIARSYYDNLAKEFQDPPGYIYNGEYAIYNNWPPIGFMVLAQWMKLLGDDNIFNARLLPSLLFTVSSVLFYLLLLRLGCRLDVAIISSILFTVLPYHLEFGKLIFSDMWLIPVWLVSCHLFISNKSYQWLIIPFGLVGTIGFMWFSFFTIPAYMTFSVTKWLRLSRRQLIILIVSGTIGFRLVLMLFNHLPEVHILSSLERWVQFPGFNHDSKSLVRMIKRVVSLIYESFPVLILFLFLIKKQGIDSLWNKLSKNKKGLRLLKFIFLTLFFYTLVLPQWVVTHTYGVSFFSIAIGLVGALLFQFSKEVFKNETKMIGISMIFCSLFLFKAYPYLTKGYRDAKPVKSTIQWMGQREHLAGLRNCVFFNFDDDEVKWHHAFEFGIKEETNSYIFSNDSLNFSYLPEYFEDGMNKLKKNRCHDFDSTKAIFVTSNPDRIEGFKILDSIKSNGINVYEIEL